jgi:flagellar biosynthetic protein FliR
LEALSLMSALQFQKFMLIFARVSTVMFLFPIFGSNQIPAYLKAGLSAAIAFILVLALPTPLEAVLPWGLFLVQVALQILVGIIIGYTAFVVFMAILLAGQIVDIEMGFAMANVIDPVSNIQQSLIGQFQNLLAFMFFLAVDGHHKLILVLTRSFDVVPMGGGIRMDNAVGVYLIEMFGNIFYLALQLAFPIIAGMFLTDLILGLLSRLVPQMNVFVVGFPIKLALGMWILIFMLGTLVFIYPEIFDDNIRHLMQLERLLGPVPAPSPSPTLTPSWLP